MHNKLTIFSTLSEIYYIKIKILSDGQQTNHQSGDKDSSEPLLLVSRSRRYIAVLVEHYFKLELHVYTLYHV
jgi:hypothetical protein